MNRTTITLLAVAIAVGVAVAFMSSNDKKTPVDLAKDANTAPVPQTPAPAAPSLVENPAPTDGLAPGQGDNAAPASPSVAPAAAGSVTALPELVVLEAAEVQPEPTLGSDEKSPDNPAMMKVVLTPWGAGVKQISLSQYSKVALEHQPYLLQQAVEIPVGGSPRVLHYPLAAQSIIVNGQPLVLSNMRWQVVEHAASHAVLSITIADKVTSAPVLQIIRTYRLLDGSYDLQLTQELKNLGSASLSVRLIQLGQTDMSYEPSYMGDKRSVILGYFQTNYDRTLSTVFVDDFDFSRVDVMTKPEHATLWPTPAVASRALQLSFVAETSRYFATAVHAPALSVEGSSPSISKFQAQPLDALFSTVTRLPTLSADHLSMAIQLSSKTVEIAPGGSANLDLGLFAGPKSSDVIASGTAYSAVGLQHLIIYNLGGCCSFLTFGWLAKWMLVFLTFLHTFLFDWGIAIIILVLVIRAILHPITKKSQLNMMKFSRQMQAMGPELEKIKKKYADDKNKLNTETMKLYRERGVNPAAMAGGCLPMLLQMPIWYALYAMLFFAIELRHQPAFYNIFHKIGDAFGMNWSFLTDLSNADHFILLGKAAFTIPFVGWEIDAINILPLLMGVVFYFQQKYTTMTPTNASEMTDQQKTQMKMMKFMIFLFPVFLYKAPSGLNLYILASTAAGIIDSKIVRNHLKQLESRGELDKPAPKKQAKPGGFIDRLQKAAEAKRKQMEQAQRQGNKKPRSR